MTLVEQVLGGTGCILPHKTGALWFGIDLTDKGLDILEGSQITDLPLTSVLKLDNFLLGDSLVGLHLHEWGGEGEPS